MESESGPEERRAALREYIVMMISSIILALYITTFVAHPMSVPTPSMSPAIMPGDRLIVDKFTLRNHNRATYELRLCREIRRGDVIVFKYPRDPHLAYVKRVIGLPGELVEIKGKKVYVNGTLLSEPYTHYTDRDGDELEWRGDFGPLRVAENHYFVMGDNRDNSEDSRYWGLVHRDLVIGRPLFVFWSYDDEAQYRYHDARETLGLYLDRVMHLFSKTRWQRLGTIIR